MKLETEARFEAAHKLFGTGGPCDRLHGHSYKVKIAVEGEVKEGMVVDFSDLKSVVCGLDHQYLNDLTVFRNIATTAENIASYIAETILGRFPALTSITVSVWETEGNCATVCL